MRLICLLILIAYDTVMLHNLFFVGVSFFFTDVLLGDFISFDYTPRSVYRSILSKVWLLYNINLKSHIKSYCECGAQC